MFTIFKKSIQKLYNHISQKLSGLFARNIIDHETIKRLEQILLEADIGIESTRMLIKKINDIAGQQTLTGSLLKNILSEQLHELLIPWKPKDTAVIMLVGINGSGKTTAAAKLAALHQSQGKKVLLVAADTFRAAAVEQLNEWAQKLVIPLIKPTQSNSSPGAVIFNGCKEYITHGYDIVIIDTAGRLQTKINLMHELEKLRTIILKHIPAEKISTLLTIDGMLGQSSLDQAHIFNECTPIDGIILTKMDGTAKGGVVFTIAKKLHIPVAYISMGEKVTDIALFDTHAFVKTIIGD